MADLSASTINSAFNVPSFDALLSPNNVGSTLDGSAGVDGGQPSINPTGNSLLDSIGQLSAIAGNVINTGLSAYSSFLNRQAITNAANRLGTTPTAVTGAINTVPLTAQQKYQQGFLYVGLAAVGAVILYRVAKKR